MAERSETAQWAREMFGCAELGDARRTARLVKVAAGAAKRPSGRLSEVFRSPRELDAAYDFVEHGQTTIDRLEAAVGRATAQSCVGQRYVFVPVDGSSVNLVDQTGGSKGFGSIGTTTAGACGLKVMSAEAIGADGVPVGVLTQSWWTRAKATKKRSAKQKKRDRLARAAHEKETKYWLETIERSAERLHEVGVRGWFQLDREGDAWPTLLKLATSAHLFTVRSAWDRVIDGTGQDKPHLRARMAASGPMGSYDLVVPGSATRTARRARMVMHAEHVTLRLHDKLTGVFFPLAVHVVWVHEHGTTPRGEKPLDWMLLTNAPVDTADAARQVVLGYSTRWRIEEFHKTWKSAGCHVEDTQLRSRDAVIRWATILAVVATRIERLKHLGRTEPDRPASDELTQTEIDVLLVIKRREKKRTETVPNATPTIAQAVRWIADIGGYTGKTSGGPPGSVTIGRGLERLRYAVMGAIAMREALK